MAPPDDPSPHTTTEEEDWQQLGDVPFRKWTCYPSLPWGLALDDHLVVGAANGGPLAVLRDDKRAVATTERLGGFLRIYSSAGVLLGQVPWELGRKVVEFGWTDAEELVVVLETGVVHWYTLLGHKVEESNKTTRLFADGSPRRVINAAVWGGGYVALADDYTLHVYDGTKTNPDARLFCLAATGLSGQRSPTSMALLQPSSYYASSSTAGEEESSSSSSSGGGPSTPLQILLGTSDNCLLVLESERGTAEVYNLNDTLPSPVTKMAASPDGRFLGCFAEGLLSVYTTSTFSKVLDPFDAGTSHPPLAMGWCGKDALVLYWRVMGLLLVGPYGDFLHFPYSEPLALVPEVDCCRVLTTGACEMLQRVPPSTEAIHRIGSTEPAAMLFDAMEAFEKGDPKADENIRSIINSDPTSSSSFSSSSAAVAKSNQLHGAVQACLRAALAAWDVGRQKKYLQAASYGKGFYDDEQRHQHHALLLDEDGEEEGGGGGGGGSGKEEEEEAGADEFVTVCRKLRVLNQLRRPAIGLPLTAQQLEKGGGWALLIDRLVLRRHYFLALKVCDYLRLQQEKERVLIHWACAYLQSRQALAQSDEEIREEIRRKVDSAFSSSSSSSSSTPSISYAAIARTADKVRRRGLATMLLAYEPSATQHVELLLEMREFELALSRALASNDLDLSYRALLHIEAHKPSQEAFLRLLSTHPSALSLLRIYYRHKLTKEDRTPWFNLSLARGDFVEAGTILAFQAYAQESLPRRIEMLKEAARLYGHQGIHSHLPTYSSFFFLLTNPPIYSQTKANNPPPPPLPPPPPRRPPPPPVPPRPPSTTRPRRNKPSSSKSNKSSRREQVGT